MLATWRSMAVCCDPDIWLNFQRVPLGCSRPARLDSAFGNNFRPPLQHTAGRLQAALDQFLPEPLRELFAVAKLPPIAAVTAHGFLTVNLHVTTGRAPH